MDTANNADVDSEWMRIVTARCVQDLANGSENSGLVKFAQQNTNVNLLTALTLNLNAEDPAFVAIVMSAICKAVRPSPLSARKVTPVLEGNRQNLFFFK